MNIPCDIKQARIIIKALLSQHDITMRARRKEEVNSEIYIHRTNELAAIMTLVNLIQGLHQMEIFPNASTTQETDQQTAKRP